MRCSGCYQSFSGPWCDNCDRWPCICEPDEPVDPPASVTFAAVVSPEQKATVPFAPGTPLTVTFYPCRCGKPGETWPCAGCLAATGALRG